MSEPKSGARQIRNAESTRTTILNAAEAIFAEHGFDGARIDAIALASGYNLSLIFRYFGDKLGLYTEILKRIDQQASELQAQVFRAMLADETIISDIHRFRTFLTTAIGIFFDYMLEHPLVMRMMVWEHAEGWQTYVKVASLFEIKGSEQLEEFFSKVQKAGLMRAGGDPFVLLLLAEQICWTFPTSLPFYNLVLPDRDLSSAAAKAHFREYLINFIVSGLLVDGKGDEPLETRQDN